MFAFAITLWQANSRVLPWSDISLQEIGPAVLAGKRPKIRKSCPAEYANIIKMCWAQIPDERPEPAEVIEMIKHLPDYPAINPDTGATVLSSLSALSHRNSVSCTCIMGQHNAAK